MCRLAIKKSAEELILSALQQAQAPLPCDGGSLNGPSRLGASRASDTGGEIARQSEQAQARPEIAGDPLRGIAEKLEARARPGRGESSRLLPLEICDGHDAGQKPLSCINCARQLGRKEGAETLAAPREPGEWAPIETAPRDRTVIGALIRDGRVWRVHEMKHNGLAFYTLSGGSLPQMTHWMPLPAPPAPPAEGRTE